MFFDIHDLPFSTGHETAQSEVNYTLTHPLGTLYNQLERLKRPTMAWQGETDELQKIQNQLIALQKVIKGMIETQSEELVNEWNEVI